VLSQGAAREFPAMQWSIPDARRGLTVSGWGGKPGGLGIPLTNSIPAIS
jgi:hypothetical protein